MASMLASSVVNHGLELLNSNDYLIVNHIFTLSPNILLWWRDRLVVGLISTSAISYVSDIRRGVVNTTVLIKIDM
jgi:hypothetical protein